MSQEVWYLRRVNDDTLESELFDVEVTKSVNRFARKGIAWIDDTDGTRWADYPRGTAVEFLQGTEIGYGQEYGVSYGTGGTRQFAGWIAERREADRAGADTLELTVYSYDHWLKRNNVDRDFSGKTISEALQEIIEDFTPVQWVASNVTVTNDVTLNRNFDGLSVDNAIAELASKSANEQFGVNNDIEFFFEQREQGAAPRDIDNTQWLTYDIPERGKEAVNEVELFYGTGNNKSSVIVTDGADKQDLESKTGAAGPVTFRKEVTFESIDNETDARQKAEEILNDRSPTLSGSVTSYGLYDATPGQQLNVTIDERGLDTEFRIAELTYKWGRGETVVSIVERRGQQDDTIVRLTDTLDRVEQRPADRDAQATQFQGPLVSGNELQLTASAFVREFGTSRFNPGFGRDELGFGRAAPGFDLENTSTVTETASRATESLLNALRDGWAGDPPPAITRVSIGGGSDQPKRTDTSLASAVDDYSATRRQPDATTARFDASGQVPQAIDLQEVGIETSGGTLHGRLTVDALSVPSQAPIDVRIDVTVSDNPDLQGVITTAGSTLSRDIITDNNPATPSELAFGTDDSEPSTSDTSLNSQERDVTISDRTDKQVGEVDLEAEFTNNTGGAITYREWGLKDGSGTLLSHLVFADLILEDGDKLVGTQRIQQRNA